MIHPHIEIYNISKKKIPSLSWLCGYEPNNLLRESVGGNVCKSLSAKANTNINKPFISALLHQYYYPGHTFKHHVFANKCAFPSHNLIDNIHFRVVTFYVQVQKLRPMGSYTFRF